MKRKKLHILCLLAVSWLLFGPTNGFSQDDTARLLRTWMEGQRSIVENIGSLQVSEHAVYELDGGFGRQLFEFDALRSMGPEADAQGREMSNMKANGRAIPDQQVERFMRNISSSLRPEVGRHLQAFRFPIQEIARMTPSRQLSEERRDGEIMWRVDMAARNREGPFERLTLWFGKNPFQLKASLAVAAAPGRSSIQIRTEYQRIGTLDMPATRVVEGSVPVRRRMRMFTMLFNHKISYTGYELSPKE